MTEPIFRPAVRVICLDAARRVLMLRWIDPHDGNIIWEPPGGGIDPGETPVRAARRELTEETGLDPAAIEPGHIDVHRAVTWNGKRFAGPEQFFLARFDVAEPALARDGLLPDEQINLSDHAWVPVESLGDLDGQVEPPELAEVIAVLVGRPRA